MGLINNIWNAISFKQIEKKNNSEAVEDGRIQNCPYCKTKLKKIPEKKTKCSKCGEFIYIRTTTENKKLIVTREQANIIDKELGKIKGKTELEIYDSDTNDIKWGKLNQSLILNAKMNDWGFYRCDLFEMGNLLKNEGRLKYALVKYLEVCYLDLNGVNNVGSSDPSVLKYNPPFNPSTAFLAPGVITLIKKILNKLTLEEDSLKLLFLETSKKLQSSLGLTISPENCWQIINEKIMDGSKI